MTQANVDWKSRAAALFASLPTVDRSWLPEPLQRDGGLLDVAMLGQTTRRLVYKCLLHRDRAGVDANVVPPSWARQDPASQRRLVLRLGALACSMPLRRTIEKDELAALLHVIDERTYREALALDSPLIANDVDDAFRRAVRADRIGYFLAGIGLSVLQSAGPEHDAVVRLRLRYLFSAMAWSAKRTDLVCDRERVVGLLDRMGDD